MIEQQQRFCTAYINGVLPLDFCRQNKISEQIFRQWLEDPDFFKAFKLAREQLRVKLLKAVTEKAFQGDAGAVEFLLRYHGFTFSESSCYPNSDYGSIEEKIDNYTDRREGFIPSLKGF